jgi:acyl-CoA synthetase (AMP-forming)/AMP-acid ligase II
VLTQFPVAGWFSEEHVEPYPYNKTFEQAEWDPWVVLHTSGSTGLPKPIVVRQGMLAIGDKYHNLGEWKGRRIWVDEISRRSKRILNPSKQTDHLLAAPIFLSSVYSADRQCSQVPMYHAAGLYLSSLMVHYWDLPIAFGIGDRPLSADMAVECLRCSDTDAVFLPPAILEELSQLEEGVAALKQLKLVCFGGGKQLPIAAGRPMQHAAC